MATINITDLRPEGCALFLDRESYLEDLSDDIANGTYGGGIFTLISGALPQVGAAVGGAAIASAAFTFNVVKNWGR